LKIILISLPVYQLTFLDNLEVSRVKTIIKFQKNKFIVEKGVGGGSECRSWFQV